MSESQRGQDFQNISCPTVPYFFFTASRSEHDVRNRNQENTGLPDMEYFENLVRQLAILTLCFPFSFSTVSLSQSLPFG